MDDRRRWDTDERGIGIADAATAIPDATRLLAKLSERGWVAEEPDVHLTPHLLAAAGELGIDLVHAVLADGVLEVTISPVGETNPRLIRSVVHSLVGSIAEASTLIRESGAGRTYDVVTGTLEGDSPFASHGHVVRFVVVPGAAGVPD